MNEKFLDYRPAHLVKGKGNWYVAYSAMNPETGKLVVKRVKLNYIKSARQRKEYADELIKQINGIIRFFTRTVTVLYCYLMPCLTF